MMKRQSFPAVLMTRGGSLFIGAVLMLGVIFGCRASYSEQCTGEVVFEGRTFTALGKSATEAQLFACNKYCLEVDAEFDARYRIWLDSPKGKAAGRPSKQESIYKDKDLLDYVTLTCAQKCVDSVNAGRLKGATKCP